MFGTGWYERVNKVGQQKGQKLGEGNSKLQGKITRAKLLERAVVPRLSCRKRRQIKGELAQREIAFFSNFTKKLKFPSTKLANALYLNSKKGLQNRQAKS